MEVVTPEHGASSKLRYRALRLKNGLRVILCHDPESEISGASLAVNVGCLSDPKEAQGLAHFLEHMLFMGNQKYPDENSFMRFVSQAGGMTNAYTDREVTSYSFTSVTPQFEDGLDRFAQFFISPLFRADCVSREINAVHSEHQKNVTSDLWRREQLYCNLARKDHPESQFGTGSLETLDEEPKKAGTDIRQMMINFYNSQYSAHRMGVAIHSQLPLDRQQELVQKIFADVPCNPALPAKITFSDDVYDDEFRVVDYKMTSISPTEELEMVWNIPSTEPLVESQIAHLLTSILGYEGAGSFTDVLKKKGWITAALAWTSEVSFLTRVQLKMPLTEAGRAHIREIEAVVHKYIALFANAPDEFLESYVREKQSIYKIMFDTASKPSPYRNVTSLAVNALYHPLERIVSGPNLLFKPNTSELRKALRLLSPLNLHSVLSSPTFAGKHENPIYDHHYKTEYSIQTHGKTRAEQLERVKERCPGLKLDAEGNVIDIDISAFGVDTLFLPDPNPFIPKSMELYADEEGTVEKRSFDDLAEEDKKRDKFALENEGPQIIQGNKVASYVQVLRSHGLTCADHILRKVGCSCLHSQAESKTESQKTTPSSEPKNVFGSPAFDPANSNSFMSVFEYDDLELWYKYDPLFHLPTTCVTVVLQSLTGSSSPLSEAALSIWAKALDTKLQADLYAADDAGTHFNVSFRDQLEIQVNGYTEIVPRVLERVINAIQDPNFVDESAFELARETYILHYQKWAQTTMPVAIANSVSSWCRVPLHTIPDLLNAARRLNVDVARTMLQALHTGVRTYALVHGNAPRSTAESIGNLIRSSIKALPSSWNTRRPLRMVKYPMNTSTIVPFRLENTEEPNSAIVNTYFLCTSSPKIEAMNIILDNFLGDSAFDTLRTAELLGYIVRGSVTTLYGVLRIDVMVQSLCGPRYLDGRIEAWIEHVLRPLVEGFKDEADPDVESSVVTFPALKKAAILQVKSGASARGELTERFKHGIASGTMHFDRERTIVEELEKLTAEDIKAVFRQYLYYDSPERRKLSVQAYSHSIPFVNKGETYTYPADDPNRLKAAELKTDEDEGESEGQAEGEGEESDKKKEGAVPDVSSLKQPPALVGAVRFLTPFDAFMQPRYAETFGTSVTPDRTF